MHLDYEPAPTSRRGRIWRVALRVSIPFGIAAAMFLVLPVMVVIIYMWPDHAAVVNQPTPQPQQLPNAATTQSH